MGWERQKSTVAELPVEPSIFLWLISGVVNLIIGMLLFVLHANQMLGPIQQYNLWLVSSAPVVFWVSVICMRGWCYNRVFEKHKFESDEAAFAQRKWVSWAGRYMSVLHSGVILPEFITPATLLKVQEELEQHYKQARRINFEEDKCGFCLLIKSVSDVLGQLPFNLPINVTLLTDSQDNELSLQKIFSEAWQESISPCRPVPKMEIFRSPPFLSLDELIKSSTFSVELIFVYQMEGKDKYSDALAVLLLASDDITAKYQFCHSARILRPMSLDTSALDDELSVFFSTQIQANSTRCITGDRSHWGDIFSTILKASKQSGGHWKSNQLHWLETFSGISGPFSPWVMAAVSSDIVRLKQADCLVLCTDGEQSFINTVTTGNKNNGNG